MGNVERGKTCPDCERELPIESFARNAWMRDGLQFYCRQCSSRRTRESRIRRLGPPKTRRGMRPSNVPDGSKWCADCDEIKLAAEFSRNRTSRSGHTTYCKPCTSERNRESHLRRAYGLTEDDLDAMRESQRGLCAICREATADHVDHDHRTGRVRGMLCFNCNGALGQFRDRTDLMQRAVSYLDPTWHPPVIHLYRPGRRLVVTMAGHRAA